VKLKSGDQVEDSHLKNDGEGERGDGADVVKD
jgi:hypothetical protein